MHSILSYHLSASTPLRVWSVDSEIYENVKHTLESPDWLPFI